MSECSLLLSCGFFKKYKETKNFACKSFVNQYCIGPEMEHCERKKYRQEHGVPPSDEMMPNGKMIVL